MSISYVLIGPFAHIDIPLIPSNSTALAARRSPSVQLVPQVRWFSK
ncbi:MAG TPA: hypothetical protein VMU99_02525 [Acidimicrobiales bacterium]|nr:hypothetical protein [Acidimicrobiales bacterium]